MAASPAPTATPTRPRSISDVARETGLTAHTLRYYERAGLMLEPIARAASSHRRYTEAEVDWVVLLGRLRGTGMPIHRIREYTELVRAGESTEDQRLALLETHRAAVVAELDAVRRNLEAIDRKITIYRERTRS